MFCAEMNWRPKLRLAWLAVGICCSTFMLVTGCNDVSRTTLEKRVSPDKLWEVVIEKEEHGGLGTAGTLILVNLARLSAPDRSINVLTIEDDGNGSPKAIVGWRGSKHLDIVYSGGILDFQAVQAGGIEIQTVKN
jgi:hypothetical protein